MPIPKELEIYAAKLGYPGSETLARIFEILFEGEGVSEILQAMPGTLPELAERTGWSENKVLAMANRLKERGAIGHPIEKPDVYHMFSGMIEMRDASIIHPNAPQELFELWEKLINTESGPFISALKKHRIPPIVRVIPVEHTIEAPSTVLDIDTARGVFKEAELISVLPCGCRTQARRNGRGQDCPAPETSVCLQINGFARMVLDRGLAERISVSEALKRVGDAEDAGLVHMTRNNVKRDMFICNCCSCCCTGFHFLQQLDYTDSIAPSRFRVKLDDDACTGCGICVDRCQFHAIDVQDVAEIQFEKCYGCGNCVTTCPEDALTLEEIRPKEHIRVK